MLAPDAGFLSPRGTVTSAAPALLQAPRRRRVRPPGLPCADQGARGVRRRGRGALRVRPEAGHRGRLLERRNSAASTLLSSAGTLPARCCFVRWCRSSPTNRSRSSGPASSSARARAIRSSGRVIPSGWPELLQICGADVTLTWQPGGHTLTRADVAAAYDGWRIAVSRKNVERTPSHEVGMSARRILVRRDRVVCPTARPGIQTAFRILSCGASTPCSRGIRPRAGCASAFFRRARHVRQRLRDGEHRVRRADHPANAVHHGLRLEAVHGGGDRVARRAGPHLGGR